MLFPTKDLFLTVKNHSEKKGFSWLTIILPGIFISISKREQYFCPYPANDVLFQNPQQKNTLEMKTLLEGLLLLIRHILYSSGIFKDVPDNSHLKFDFVASIEVMKSFKTFNGWWNNSGITYIILPTALVKETLEPKLLYFMEKYLATI